MIEISPKLWIGADADVSALPEGEEWVIVHGAKEPHHRKLLGYTTRAAPKDHPEYLFAIRPNRLYLNLVDVPNPEYVSPVLVDAAMAFIAEHMEGELPILVACNQGQSRAPTLGMLHLAPALPEAFEEAETEYLKLYPAYAPGNGMREFAKANWAKYRTRNDPPAEPQPEAQPDAPESAAA